MQMRAVVTSLLVVVVGVCVAGGLLVWLQISFHSGRRLPGQPAAAKAQPNAQAARPDDAIPPDVRIDILRHELKDLQNNKSQNFDRVAELNAEVDFLAADLKRLQEANAPAAELDAKKALVDAKEQALLAARQQLDNLDKLTNEMQTRLDQMQDELRNQGDRLGDGEKVRIEAQMDDMRERIERQQKDLELKDLLNPKDK